MSIVEDQHKAAGEDRDATPTVVQSVRDRGRERLGIGVGLVQRHPGTRATALGRPLREQRRLAVAGRRRQQNQGTAPLLLQLTEELSSANGSSRASGAVNFGSARSNPKRKGVGASATHIVVESRSSKHGRSLVPTADERKVAYQR